MQQDTFQASEHPTQMQQHCITNKGGYNCNCRPQT